MMETQTRGKRTIDCGLRGSVGTLDDVNPTRLSKRSQGCPLTIHPVVNVSRICRYVGQVEGQKKEQLLPVINEGEEEWEVERILNKRRVRGKDKYLVRWKGFMAESDTWEGRENLKNAKEAIEEFEEEYRQDMEDVAQQEREETTFKHGELPGRFMAKMLYEWSDKRYDQEYWGRMEKN